MTQADHQVRVFISSTFRDMHAERDHLVTVVFPELRERVERLGLEFFDVDLRWGVPETEGDGEKANSWEYCKRWIGRVEPFFVCMLGQRYGWVPKPHEIKDDDDRKLWAGQSVTDMEIRHAVLSRRVRRRSTFYLRETLVPEPPRTDPAIYGEFVDTDPISFRNLEQLKSEIRTCNCLVRPYACRWTGKSFEGLDAFGRMVLEDLWSGVLRDERYVSKDIWRQALGADPNADPRYTDESNPVPPDLAAKLVALAKPPPKDPLDAEREQMEAFAQTRLRWFQGRTYELQQLTDFIQCNAEGAPRLAVAAAAPGQGKSALIARLWKDLTALTSDQSAFLIAHFVGATERSASAHALVQRLLDELDRSDIEWPADEQKEGKEPKLDFNSLCSRLRQRLGDYAGERRIVILLDALNQLYDGHDLQWLPARLGSGVRVVVSCIENSSGNSAIRNPQSELTCEQRVLHALTSRQSAPLHVPLGPLTEDDVRTIVVEYLKEYCKELDTTHVKAICAMPQARSPLYLLVLLGELRTLGGNDMNNIVPALIASMPREYPDTVSLFRWVLQRLEVFGKDAVRWWCLYLAHGRVGMASHELADLLDRKFGKDARTAALRIERGLRRYLQRRGGQLDFFHSQLRQAVMELYGAGTGGDGPLEDGIPADPATRAHRDIADYFETLWRERNTHALEELPWQQVHGRQWMKLNRTLTDLDFLQAKCESGMLYDLLRDYVLAVNCSPSDSDMRETCHRFVKEQSTLIARGEEPFLQLASNRGEQMLRALAVDLLKKRHQPRLHMINAPSTLRWSGVLEGHMGQVNDVAVTPDTKHIVSASEDLTLRVWEVETGQCVRTLTGHGGWVRCVAACSDGARILSGSYDGTIRQWDIHTGICLSVLTGHKDTVWDVTVSPDGNVGISISDDESMKIWNLATGHCIQTMAGHFGSIVYSPDGRLLARGGLSGTIELLDPHSFLPVATFEGHAAGILGMSFTGDGRLVSACEDRTLRVWDIERCSCVFVLQGHNMIVQNVAVAPKNHMCVSTSNDQTVRVWELRTGQCVQTFTGHSDWVRGIAFISDDWIITSSGDCTLRIWHIESSASGERLI